jgi:hypothetical protein
MTSWDSYPDTYRSLEVGQILSAVRGGDCAAVVGLSGAGKSNLLGFIAHRLRGLSLPDFVLVDCNRLATPTATGFLDLVCLALDPRSASQPPALTGLEALLAARLEVNPSGISLLVDRFEALPGDALSSLSGNLRSLRDTYKYSLTYVVAIRRPLDPDLELAELFYAHTLWLGPLTAKDASWSAASFAARRGLGWSAAALQRLVELSWGYPGLLRACCEAHAAGVPLETGAMSRSPAVQRRVEEFWRDRPSPEALRLSDLEGQPLLGTPPAPVAAGPASAEIDSAGLTAAEFRLLAYFQEHQGQVCDKDALILAVWPEEVQVEGLRDDSLAQLVRRLRRKVEPDPADPSRILTLPGRGYRFVG